MVIVRVIKLTKVSYCFYLVKVETLREARACRADISTDSPVWSSRFASCSGESRKLTTEPTFSPVTTDSINRLIYRQYHVYNN